MLLEFRSIKVEDSMYISYYSTPVLIIESDGTVLVQPGANYNLESKLKDFLRSEGIYYKPFEIPRS